MEQIGIALLGVTAVWLSQDKNDKARKYAPVFGLLSQPFWFYSSYVAEQWGIFFLSVLYTWSWIKGIKNQWLGSDANV
jgi:hypothetical protein